LTWPERLDGPGGFRTTPWPGQLFELVPDNVLRFFFGSRRLFRRIRSVEAKTNSLGFRGPLPPSPKDQTVWKVLVLGDSITFGEGVADGEEFLALVEKYWRLENPFSKPVRFINTAVGGYNTSQEVAVLKRYLPQLKPDLVWLVITLEDVLPWGTVIVRENGTLFRPGAPLRHKIRDRLKAVSGIIWWLHEAFRFVRLDAYVRRLFRPDYPGYQEWRRSLAEYARIIGDPARSLVFIAPGSWKLERYPWRDVHERIRNEVELLGLPCIDLLPAFEGEHAARFWCHPLDLHPNALAHRRYAEFIAGNSVVRGHVAASMMKNHGGFMG
jgi:lysophospholipase L1-like esterase